MAKLPLYDEQGRFVSRHIFELTESIEAWRVVGSSHKNAYYGNAPIYSPDYERCILNAGEKLLFAHGYLYIGDTKFRITKPPSSEFERDGHSEMLWSNLPNNPKFKLVKSY